MNNLQAPDLQAEHPDLQDQHEAAALEGAVHGAGEEGGEGGGGGRREADTEPGTTRQDTRYS